MISDEKKREISEITEKAVEQFIRNLEERNKEREEFFHKNQSDTIERLYEFLKENAGVNDENLLYFPQDYPFTIDEFHLLEENIRNYALRKRESYSDEELMFPSESIFFKYKDAIIELSYLYGQGTLVTFSLVDNEMLSKENIDVHFNFDEIEFASE